MTKLEKIKREAKKSSKLKNDHIKSRADAERTISRFVAYRTITLPFFIVKEPALFAMKLVSL